MSTTLAILRQRLSEVTDDWSGTIATTSSGDTASVISTGLAQLDGGEDVDYFNDHYVIITETGHGALDQVRRAKDYDGISDITTVAFGSSIGSSVDFEVHRYSPDLKHAVINTALRQSFNDGLYLPIRDETLVVDNLLLNPDLEDGATNVFTSWTQTAGTWTESSTRIWHGSRSATVSASGADAQLTQNLFSSVNIHEMVGKTFSFKGRMFAAAADTARLRVTTDGGTSFTSSSFHAGDDEWEGQGTMFVTLTIPSGATSLTCYCEVADGGTAFFDSMFAYIDDIVQYTVPTTMLEGPSHIYFQSDLNNEDGLYEELPGWYITWEGETKRIQMTEKPLPGHRLRLLGKGALTALSASTDTTEISGTQVDMIVEMAAAELFRRLAGGRAASQQSAGFLAQAQAHQQVAERLRNQPGVRRTSGAQLRRVMEFN